MSNDFHAPVAPTPFVPTSHNLGPSSTQNVTPVVVPSAVPNAEARVAPPEPDSVNVEPSLSPTRLAPGLDASVLEMLRCPRCSSPLEAAETFYKCGDTGCGFEYPMTGHVPILVDPQKSVFDLATFQRQDPTFFRPVAAWRQTLSDLIPEMSRNVAADRVYGRLRSLLVAANSHSNVLVVGGGVTGSGMEILLNDSRIRLIETDAAVAPRAQLICDAHDLPFSDATMDAVVVQAVLEHVVDPVRCVSEIHRVLKPGGLVYSDTPFMQQVHGRQFDFTRFTRLGHRRLFRRFDEVESGITCGPGMALAWSLRYFLMSFWDNESYRAAASAFSRIAFWWLSLLDPCLVTRKAANDAASAFYFLGRKGETVLDDRQLLASYIGGQ